MEAQNYRQEIKFFLTPVQAVMLESRIQAVMSSDIHSSSDGCYNIRSIYFDAYSDKAYSEKQSGLAYREKFRIRFYNMSPSVIYLEKKEKRRNLIHKEALSITQNIVNQIMNGNYEDLLSIDHPLAGSVYALSRAELLKPVIIIDYTRRAYTYPAGNVRVTFDSALQSGRVTPNVWLPGILSDVLENNVILEVKFNQYLPVHIQQLICSISAPKMALSKYVIGRDNLKYKQGIFYGGI